NSVIVVLQVVLFVYLFKRWRRGKGFALLLIVGFGILFGVPGHVRKIDEFRRIKLGEVFIRTALLQLEAGEVPPLGHDPTGANLEMLEPFRGFDFPDDVTVSCTYGFKRWAEYTVGLPEGRAITVELQ